MVAINRLEELRKSQKMNMREVANKLKIPYTTYVNYEKGVREPSSEMLVEMANLYDVTVDYIIGRERKMSFDRSLSSPNITESYTTFPVIGEVAAGYDVPALEDWEGETVDIPDTYLKGRSRDEFFVLRVKGDSMFPTYQDGDKVLVLRQSTLNHSGQVGVVIYNDDCGTLKRVEYKMGEDWMRLVPINPSYPPIKIVNEELEHCKVLGIPKLLIREIEE